jgi:hypothetical protein
VAQIEFVADVVGFMDWMRAPYQRRLAAYSLVAGFLCLATYAQPADAQKDNFDLRGVAVNVHRTPVQSWPGYGIYLNDGLVVTAAHVAGHGFFTRPKVFVDGRELPTSVVKEGSYPDMDLTILRIDGDVPPELAGRKTVLCDWAPHPDERVVVATPEALTRSIIISPEILPPDMRAKYFSSIKDVYTTGNSGSGVFDADRSCLLGIMSAKIERNIGQVIDGQRTTKTIGIAKYFVPSNVIREFISSVSKG